MANVYVNFGDGSTTGYYAVTAWSTLMSGDSTANGGRGTYVRQAAAPAVNSERVFRCTASGTAGVTEPTWATTKNGTTSDGTITWTECTGQEADQVSGTWKAPHARKAAALAATWFSAGDTLYTGHNHAGTTSAALSITYPGTLANPDRDLCVLATGTVPPVSGDLRTTATETTTGNTAINFTGCAYVYGTIHSMGTGANSPTMQIGGATQTELVFDACAIRCASTTSPTISIGSNANSIGARIVWNNTTYQVGSAATIISMSRGVEFIWKNTASAITGATIPTNLFGASSVQGSTVVLDGVDLSALSAKTIVAAQTTHGLYAVKDCKLPASITINAAPTNAACKVYVIRSASGATANTLEKHDALGNQTTETTIVRTGGAQVNGTGVAMKIATTSAAHIHTPFESTPINVANTITATNRTVTVYGVWGGGAVPNNDDVWLEVGYLGSASTPLLSFASTRKADVLAGNAACSTDSSTWGGSTTAFSITATLSAPQPQLAGDMYVTVFVGATSATLYIDPLVVLG